MVVGAPRGTPLLPYTYFGGIIPRIDSGEVFMALERELATYNDKLPQLKENEGKFVLIHGDQLVDVYTSYEDAIKEGYAKFKLEPFLVALLRIRV
jgi:hypothetical protein